MKLRVPHPAGAVIERRRVSFPPDRTWRAEHPACGWVLVGLAHEHEAVQRFNEHARTCPKATWARELERT